MTVSDIQEALWKLYNNHMYHLYNSYLYNWECDYYSRSKSGKDYEVEIKLSRSDFFADFKKEKHKYFSACYGKEKFIVLPKGKYYGEEFARYVVGELRNISYRKFNRLLSQLEITESANHDDFLNGYKNFRIENRTVQCRASGTYISIRPVDSLRTPHRFYYACPDGLLKAEEVPAYAGLIHIRGTAAHEVKKAPFLHKRDIDLTDTLLKKFYYETVDHRRAIRYEKVNNRLINS